MPSCLCLAGCGVSASLFQALGELGPSWFRHFVWTWLRWAEFDSVELGAPCFKAPGLAACGTQRLDSSAQFFGAAVNSRAGCGCWGAVMADVVLWVHAVCFEAFVLVPPQDIRPPSRVGPQSFGAFDIRGLGMLGPDFCPPILGTRSAFVGSFGLAASSGLACNGTQHPCYSCAVLLV